MYLSRRKNERPKRQDKYTVHYIRTCVLNEIVLGEINKLLENVRANWTNLFTAIKNSMTKQSAELKKAKKTRTRSEKRIAELDRLFPRLYEDNVSGKISDERFTMMLSNYEGEQKRLKIAVSELIIFLTIFEKYEHITAITPEIMHELIEKIIVHEVDKSSGKCTQKY